MTEKMKLFENEWMGYKKSEVNEYIEKLDQNGSRLKEELEKSLAEQASLTGKLYSYEKSVGDYEKASEALRAAEEKIAVLEVELTKKEEPQVDLSAVSEQIAALEAENRGLKNRLMEKESESTEKNRSEKDILSDRFAYLEHISTEAKIKASQVVAEAQEKARDIIEQAKLSAVMEADVLTRESKALLEENMRKLKYIYRRRDELKQLFDDNRKKAEEIFRAVDESFPKE